MLLPGWVLGHSILDDVWTDPVRSRLFLQQRWQGRTELRVDSTRLPDRIRAQFEAIAESNFCEFSHLMALLSSFDKGESECGHGGW